MTLVFLTISDTTPQKLVLSDSIAKYVSLKQVTVLAFPGDTIQRLTDRIAFGQIELTQYQAIVIHVGTNDLSDLVLQHLLPHTSPLDLLRRYKALREVVRKRNTTAVLYFSAILPRSSGPLIKRPSPQIIQHLAYGINFALQQWCDSDNGLTFFVRSDKWFRSNGKVRDELFASSDGIHLNGGGTDRLAQCFSQALSAAGQLRFITRKDKLLLP